MKRKDMGDLRKGIADTAEDSMEIAQAIYYDAKAEAHKTAGTVDEFGQRAATKTKNAATTIKRGAHDVGRDVKQTAVNVSRGFTSSKPPHQTERVNRTQS